METTDQIEVEYWSQSEVLERFGALTEADLLRVKLVADRLAYGNVSPEDLQQEAFRRAIEPENPRRWPKHISFGAFMHGAMRSIMDSYAGASSRVEELNESDGGFMLAERPEATTPSFEVGLLDGETAAIRITTILAVFSKDKEAHDVLEGIMAGLRGKELCELADLSPDELATVRKRINRGLAREFPEGWNRHGE